MTGLLRRFVAPRTRRQSSMTATAAVLVGLLATTGCSGSALHSSGPTTTPSSSGPSSSTPPVKAPPPPDVETCRALDYSAISHYSNDDSPVPCTAPHTAFTFAIETLPDDVRVAGVSIGNRAIQHAASDACRAAFDGYIGGDPATRALSRLSVTYFLPDQDGFNAGAHWIRCDVVALKTPSSLADLPSGSLRGFLDKSTSLQDYGVCTQGVPGGPNATLVMCSQQHLYRAVTTLRLGDDKAPYPGPSVTGKQGQQRCADYLRNKLGESTGYTFGWTYPTASDWASGQRFGYCWLKNHH